MVSKIFERRKQPLLRPDDSETTESSSRYSTKYQPTRRASRGRGRIHHRGVGARRAGRGARNSLIVYIPVVVRKLNTAQTREYQAALRKFRDPFSPEARALAAKYERNIYGLFHPRLSGNFTFSATNGDVLDVLNYHLGAIDAKELDREMRMLGCTRHPDDVQYDNLSDEEKSSLDEIVEALLSDDEEAPGEEAEEEAENNSWSPFGFMK